MSKPHPAPIPMEINEIIYLALENGIISRGKACAAVQWQTARIGGRVVDSFRCLNGHSSEDGEIGVAGWVERKP